jgi:photosystem II stability/assembly factor-like uncharacterized protein
MKQCLSLLLLLILSVSCKNEQREHKPSFTSVTVDTLLQDEISIRAITIDGDKVWYSGSNGKYGSVSLSGGKALNGIIAKDTILPEFRAIAQTDTDIFILNVGSPAMLYKISKDGKRTRMVYTEAGERVFYDCIKFRNNKEGIAMGDPVNECLSILTTSDGGESWKKISCIKLPKVEEGEAAFAASNTNMVVRKDKTWIVTGGKKSRVLFSEDKGQTWEQYDTPVVQGRETTGIFSIDFYDDEVGFAVGGDFTDPKKNTANKAITTDGGKTWDLIADNTAFGYASCVQFVPGGHGNELVTTGPSGVFYSFDRGATWKMIHSDKLLHTLVFANGKTLIAAGENKVVRLTLK